MAEDNSNNNPPAPATGTAPTPPASAEFDPKTLSEEQFAKVFEDERLWTHPRTKQLMEAKKERDALKAEQAKQEEERLKEQNQWKELAEKREQEKNALLTQVQQTKVDNVIERFAAKAGVQDTDAALKLIDKSKVSFNPETGEITGAQEAIEALVKERPYLTGANNINIGAPTNPSNGNTQLKRFKLSELQDATFYQKNEKDIRASMAAGLIDTDM